MAAKEMQFPWRWLGVTISLNLKVIWEMSDEALTHGRRSPRWVRGHKNRIRLDVQPYFGNKIVSEITSGVAQKYRLHWMNQ